MMVTQQTLKFLVVEDNPLSNRLISDQLEDLGHRVLGQAFDGPEGVALTKRLTPDVVLMDLQMTDPETGDDDPRAGVKAAMEIQTQCPTPVVVLTAHEVPDLIREATAAGIGAYLLKPPNTPEIERAALIATARFDDLMDLRNLNIALQDEIAERERVEAALRQSHRRLEETLEELETTREKVIQQERLAVAGQLAVGIAHEFNNILAATTLYTDMSLREPQLPPRIRQRLDVIAQQTQQAADLVQQIVDFGQQAVLDRRTVDLAALLEETVALLERTLPQNIRIEWTREDTIPFTIHGDSTRVRQAVVNLALNARDAMPEGGRLHLGLGRLRVEEGEDPPVPEMHAGEWIQVTVMDTGTGIPPDVLPHIYEPFFTTRAPLGHGLGLSQAHGIVRQHNGHLDVHTQAGQGTTFTIYLPASEERPAGPTPAPGPGRGDAGGGEGGRRKDE